MRLLVFVVAVGLMSPIAWAQPIQDVLTVVQENAAFPGSFENV